MGLELLDNIWDKWHHHRFQIAVADVPGGNEQQLGGPALKKVRIHEIGVLGHHGTLIPIGNVVDLFVGRPVCVGQIECVNGIAPDRGEPVGNLARQLGVDQEVHGPTGWRRRV
jgi:hypothetical protein